MAPGGALGTTLPVKDIPISPSFPCGRAASLQRLDRRVASATMAAPVYPRGPSHGRPRPRSSPRARLGTVGDAAARARAGNDPDREGLRRSGGARRHRRDLRDQGRPAQRRAGRRQGLDRSRLQAGAAEGRHRGGRHAGPCQPGRRSPGRGREHAAAPQHGRLHAVLLLSVGNARPAAGLVQVGALPLARGQGSARRAGRLRRHAAQGNRDPRLGFDRRDALPGAADAARRHRGLERGAAGRSRHPRFDDRHRASRSRRRRSRT